MEAVVVESPRRLDQPVRGLVRPTGPAESTARAGTDPEPSVGRITVKQLNPGDLAVQDAENVLRSLDELHMRRVRDIYDSFWDDWPPHQRPIVAAHRARIAELLSGVDAVVIAGGHIGVLLGAMQQAATVTISSALNLWIVGWMLVIFVAVAPRGILGWFRRRR